MGKNSSVIEFSKWQGCGNDFVMIDCLEQKLDNVPELAVRWCDRHYGIGADGVILVLPSDKADFRMRIYNADGSEAEMCGNGIRCFARMVYESARTDKKEFTVETGAGILKPALIFDGDRITGICVDMGEPILEAERIPVNGFGMNRVIAEDIEVLGKTDQMTCVSMGNPHCVVFVDDIKELPIYEVGPAFEKHERFPRHINTEFVQVKDRQHLRMRVWERGAAVTLACGTGTCATLTAAVLNGKTDRKAEIELDGGILQVEWAENNHLYMTGPAELAYQGSVKI